MGLSQSDKLFGAILIGFIIYITVRGQLTGSGKTPGYLSIFTHNAGSTSSISSSGSSSTSSSGSSGTINAVVQGAKTFLQVAAAVFGG